MTSPIQTTVFALCVDGRPFMHRYTEQAAKRLQHDFEGLPDMPKLEVLEFIKTEQDGNETYTLVQGVMS